MDLFEVDAYICLKGFVFDYYPYIRNIFLLTATTQSIQPHIRLNARPSKREWLPCHQAFLFSLVNPSGLGPTKISLIGGREEFAMISYSDCGPAFGQGHDLCIFPETRNGSSDLGSSYQLPPSKQRTFFTRERTFPSTDVEVFGLRRWIVQVRKGHTDT